MYISIYLTAAANSARIKKDHTKGPQNTYFCGFSTKDIVRFVIKEFIPAREIKEPWGGEVGGGKVG